MLNQLIVAPTTKVGASMVYRSSVRLRRVHRDFLYGQEFDSDPSQILRRPNI